MRDQADAPQAPLGPVRDLARRSDHDATVLMADRAGRLFVEKCVPSPLANAKVWHAMMWTDHPALVPVWSVDEEPWGLRAVMGYVPGPTLEELVEAQGALDPATAVGLVSRAAEGAGLLHGLGIVHRDLSPANIVAGPTGACIVDAGIARIPDGSPKRHDTVLLGTPGFAAPEQYGFAQTSPRTDVYALGRIAAYLLTGISPTSPICEEALADDDVVHPALRAVIERACALEPSARQADGAAFARELQGAAQEAGLCGKAASANEGSGDGAGRPGAQAPGDGSERAGVQAPDSGAEGGGGPVPGRDGGARQPTGPAGDGGADPTAPAPEKAATPAPTAVTAPRPRVVPLVAAGAAGPAPMAPPLSAAALRRRGVPRWRRVLSRTALVAGWGFFAFMACGLFMDPSDPATSKTAWNLQCLAVGAGLGAVPGVVTARLAMGRGRIADARHPLLLWVAVLVSCLLAAGLLVMLVQPLP